jgi:hypothetical protein
MTLHPLAEIQSPKEVPASRAPGWSGILLLGGLELAALSLVAMFLLRLKKAHNARARRLKEEREASIQRGNGDHAALGSYWFTKDERHDGSRWGCQYHGGLLGYSLALTGHGAEPTQAQIARLQEIEQRMPEIIAAIPFPPEDDGWGNSLPDYQSSVMRANRIHIGIDLSSSIDFNLEPSPLEDYRLSPFADVSSDWQISARWMC